MSPGYQAGERRELRKFCQLRLMGDLVGYALSRRKTCPSLHLVGEKRAGFSGAHLWVTPDNEKRCLRGNYPTESKSGDGLPQWTTANRSVENQDVLLWYTMGITHIPRPEEWPVMNSEPRRSNCCCSGSLRGIRRSLSRRRRRSELSRFLILCVGPGALAGPALGEEIRKTRSKRFYLDNWPGLKYKNRPRPSS